MILLVLDFDEDRTRLGKRVQIVTSDHCDFVIVEGSNGHERDC